MGIYLAQFFLLGWIPFSLFLFYNRPPRQAVLITTLVGWLFMPNVGYMIPGLPDFTKFSATAAALILGVLLFDPNRLLNFRLSWIDLPAAVIFGGAFATSVTNDLGAYDGISSAMGTLINWVIPYAAGRLYLTDRDGMLELTMTAVVCGLVYVPLCLWEIRFSPNIQPYVYGLQRFFFDAPRFGLGFRPIVFLAHGLECGMFMSVAALLAYGLWLSGAVQEIRGFRFRNAAALLFLTAILCKSVGACALLACGIVVLSAVRRMRRLTAVWLLLLLPVCYMGLRMSGLWSARELVAISSALVNEDRAGSLEFRLKNEDVLMAKALQHPLLGWGGFSRNRVFNEAGKDLTVTDGYWIILLGINGLIGLSGVTGLFVAPVGRTLWNLPKRCGLAPDDAPALATGVAMILYLMDFLSNAYLSPFYGLALGGLAAYTPVWTERRGRSPDPGLSVVGELVAAGELETAELVCRHVIETGTPGSGATASLAGVAAGQQALGEVLAASGRDEEACASLAAAADSWLRHAAESPGDGMAFEGIADTYEQLARLMKARQRSGEAIEYWREALAFRDRLAAAGHSPVPLADILNDLAWFLTFGPDPLFRDPAAAVGLAERAVALLPDRVCYWNTLGAAYYRSGRPLDALRALNRSVELGEGGTAFDHYLLASTYARIGNLPEVRKCFGRAEALALHLGPGHPELAELRADASESFAIKETNG